MESYDFVIVGAGPAGLTSGIVAARLGLKTIILEKGEIAGPKPRGEGMAHAQIVDEILGKDYLPSIGLKSNRGRVWHSPKDLQTTTTYRTYDHYFFEWREFIDRFVEVAQDLGVQILLNSEVIAPLEKNDACIGVKYKDANGAIQELYGNVVLDCSGYSAVLGRHYDIPYDEEIICPIIKCLISEANIDIKNTPDLQFYFIGNGDLDYSPQFPPCVAYLFPLDNKRAEVGLMLRMAQARNMKTVSIPSENEIMKVWDEIKKSYPGFSVFFKGAKIDYEELTWLPNAKMVDNYIPISGIVLIGDSAAFVNPFGSSGLVYSMEMANFWVNLLSKQLKELKGHGSEKLSINKKLFEKTDEYKKKFEESKVYKQVKGYYNLIGAFEYKIFNRLRTAERINKKWDYISSLLKQA
jgi:flavin-dependent dehydrogenase